MADKIEKIQEKLGKQLVSVLEYDRGGQQVYLFVVKSIDLEMMEALRKLTTAQHLFLSVHEVQDGVDVFPLEFLHIKNHHKLLSGKDMFSPLTFEKKHVRRQLEFEFRSKLIHFREEYLISNGKKQWRNLLLSALPALSPIFDGLLYLKSKKSSADEVADFRVLQEEYGEDFSIFRTLEGIKNKKSGVFGKAKYLKGKEKNYTKELLVLLENLSAKLDKI